VNAGGATPTGVIDQPPMMVFGLMARQPDTLAMQKFSMDQIDRELFSILAYLTSRAPVKTGDSKRLNNNRTSYSMAP